MTVTIYAKKLRFEGNDARLKTTPLEKNSRPETGMDGLDGLNAGNVTLHIGDSDIDSSGENIIRFDLTGGKGQDGGEGKDGEPGPSLPHMGSNSIDLVKEFGKDLAHPYCPTTYTAEKGYNIICMDDYFWGSHCPQYSMWPDNGSATKAEMTGTPPLAPGIPGNPGAGGRLAANYDITPHAAYGGGVCGCLPEPAAYCAGKPGQPNKWVKLCHYSLSFITWFAESEKVVVEPAGKEIICSNYAAQKQVGDSSEFVPMDCEHSWLHPSLVNVMLTCAKDYYINNNITGAEFILRNYHNHVNLLQKTEAWPQLPDEQQLELKQMYDEMQILLHRIKHNLDYFGNPAGWVPLLSYEVEHSAFKKEIKHAATILYYAYCIQNTLATAETKFNALTSLRDQLEKDIDEYVCEYNDAMAQLDHLEGIANKIEGRKSILYRSLQDLEQNFEEQGRMTAGAVSTLRLSLKIAGTVVSMIPVGQPATGIVGSGISLLSNFDPEKPWDTIIDAGDIAGKYLKSEFASEAKSAKTSLEKAQKTKTPGGGDKEKEEWIKTCNALSDSGSALTDGLKDIKEFINDNSESDAIIEAQLEYLKSQSKDYQAIAGEIDELLDIQQNFSDRIADAMENVATLCNSVSQSMLALDATKTDIDQVRKGLDKRVMAYVDGLEHRAYDRLLKYHYYFAKAFEYRLLTPYTNKLDVERVIHRLESVTKVDCWDKLDAETFKNTYEIVYSDYLSEIASDILEKLRHRSGEKTCKFERELSQAELERLNSGNTIEVDFSRNIKYEESLRIVDVGILMFDDNKKKGHIKTSGTYSSRENMDLVIEHPSISKLRSENRIYQFQHPDLEGDNPLTWRIRYTPKSENIDKHTTSAAGDSLLQSLLSEGESDKILLYSRPSVWTKLKISKKGNIAGGENIKLESCTLELTYDYYAASNSTTDIEVQTMLQSQQDEADVAEAGIKPYFIVDKEDVNHLRDARGDFLRIYKPDYQSSVTITAQPSYGNYLFKEWTDEHGNKLPTAKDQTVVLDLQAGKTIKARYMAAPR